MKPIFKLNRNCIIPISTGIFLAAAVAKIAAFCLLKSSSGQPDLVLWFLPSRTLSLAVALMEFLCVIALLDARVPRLDKLFIVLALGSCFLGYRMSQLFHFGATSCGCFGLTPSNPISSMLLKTMMNASVFYLVAGSLVGIFNEDFECELVSRHKGHYAKVQM